MIFFLPANACHAGSNEFLHFNEEYIFRFAYTENTWRINAKNNLTIH